MRTKPQSSQRKMSCVGMVITLVVIILFSCSQKAFAQQWSTSGNGNDIFNSNSGNVGVGTTSPGVKLDILSSVNLIARFGSTAGAHSQVLIDAPAAFNSNLTLQRGGVSKWYMGNRASNDRLSFVESTGVIETLTLLQNGNVGVGTTSPGERLVTFGNLLVGNITTHTQLYPTYDSHSPVILELGYGTATASATPYPSLVLSKNLTSTNNLAGAIFFANSNIANDSEKRLSGIATWTDGALNSGALQFYTSSVGTFTETLRIASSGNVGIGTTTPNRKLELVGDVAGISLEAGTGSPNSGVIRFGDNTGWKFHFGRSRNSSGGALNSGTSGVLMTIQDNGNVGIGNTNPGYKLDVSGEINATGFRINGTPISTGPVTWAQVDKSTSSLADIQTRNAGDLNAGTVPIGRIGLSGNAGVSTFLRGDNTWGPVPSSQWTSGTNNISYNAGNVGIGTASPGFLLDVSGGTNNPFRVRDSSGREYFSTTTRTGPLGTAPVVSIASGRLIIDNNGPDGGNDTIVSRAVNSLVLVPSADPALPGALMVLQVGGSSILYVGQNANGNVGIGTTTPGAKLEVVGNVNVTGTGNITAAGTIEGGNIKAKYQDVAEWVESSQELPAGTVVVVDHTKSNQVIASSQAYDTRVAGVISERPGITLGEGGNNKVLVATTGRVSLRVDASNGPIQIGDLLVTSDISGVAMKSEAINVGGVQIHRPGTLIGKALEPLQKGMGEILVLLSLQ